MKCHWPLGVSWRFTHLLEIKEITNCQSILSRSWISSLGNSSCELQWLVYLLADFHIQHSQPALLYTDSKPTSEIVSNPVCHERTKHIQLDCHLIREKLQEGLLNIIYIPSRFQLADALTKPLGCLTLTSILSKMGMVNIHSHHEGGY